MNYPQSHVLSKRAVRNKINHAGLLAFAVSLSCHVKNNYHIKIDKGKQ